MERKISASVVVKSNGNFLFNIIEKINGLNVAIFSSKMERVSDRQTIILFLNNTMTEVKNTLNIKIDYVSLILDYFTHFELYVATKRTSQKIANNKVTKQDIDTLHENVLKENNIKARKIIQFQPIQYHLFNNGIKRSYNEPPVEKNGEDVTCVYSISYIDQKYYDSFEELFSHVNLKMKSIFTTSHLNTCVNSNSLNLANKTVVLDFEEEFSRVNIHQKNALILTKSTNLSFKTIITKIAFKEKITYDQAKEQVLLYSDFNPNWSVEKEFLPSLANKKNHFIDKHQKNIESFIKRLVFEIQNRLNENNIKLNNTPFFINGFFGLLKNITEYVRSHLNYDNIVQLEKYNYLAKDTDLKNSFSLVKYYEANKLAKSDIAETLLDIKSNGQFIKSGQSSIMEHVSQSNINKGAM